MNAIWRYLTAGICGAMIMLAGSALAQPVPEAALDDDETTRPMGMMDTISEVFGEGGVILTTGKPDGEIIQTSNEEGEMISLIARYQVVLKSDKLDLDSDYLQIDMMGRKVIATGNVYLRIQDKTAICGRFEYDIERKRSILRENPRILGSGTNAASSIDVTACEIIIEEDAQGKTQTILRACPDRENVLTIGRESEQKVTPPPSTGATPIDVNNPSDVERVLERRPGGAGQSGAASPSATPAPAIAE